jgi:hypothetical protein
MATNKKLAPNIDNSDLVNFPNGRIKDNDGTGDGTPVNRLIYSDLHEFFAKLMREAGISYNALPESEGNGYQLIAALMNFASKNNYLQPLNVASVVISGVTTNVLSLGLKISTLKAGEFLLCQATADYDEAITKIKGSETGVYKNISVPEDYLANEYLLVVNNTTISIIRLATALNFAALADENGYLKAATDLEEITGTATDVATTPASNLSAFDDRVNGSSSSAFLSTDSQNGLMSASDKTKLDGMTNPVKNVGWFSGLDPGGMGIGVSLARHGDVVSAVVTSNDTSGNSGSSLTITIANAMTGMNFFVRMHVESQGSVVNDRLLRTPVFVPQSTTTFTFSLSEAIAVIQSVKIHIEVVQIS